MAKELASFNKYAGTHYPAHLTITIANFNTDYPETYVFVAATGEVFHVGLHPPSGATLGAVAEQGDYPIGQEYGRASITGLEAKIRRHGIVRDISLRGG